MSRANGDKDIAALNLPERSQPRAVMPAAKSKASRHAVTGLLAKDNISLPVA